MTTMEQRHSGGAPTSVISSLGSSGGNAYGQPSWFDPNAFLAPEFNAQAYVADLRKYVPLEVVSQELEGHLATLKNKLVEVINEDYNDFVSLSTKLVNIDGSVLRMQKPLVELKERLGAVQAAIRGQLDQLNEGLARRQAVASARATLELMQDTAHVMSKVEKLVAEAGDVPSPSGLSADDLDSHARLLERVAGEVARLKFYATRGQDLPFVAQLSGRITAASGTLEGHLNSVLEAGLSSGHQSAVFHCLHAYAAASNTAAGEAVIRRCVVAPVVAEAVAAARADGRAAPAAVMLPEALRTMLTSVVSLLRSRAGGLLDQALSPSSGLQSFNLLANSVLAEVDSQLAEHLPGAFSPGVPDAFLGNYKAGVAFLDDLEGLCTTQGWVSAFRSAEAYGCFMRRWNLPVYFSLRFREVASDMEAAAAAPVLQMAPPPAADGGEAPPWFHLATTAACWRCLAKCADDGVFLRPLADRFLRLALQLLSRYAHWVQAAADARRAADAAGGGGTGGSAADGPAAAGPPGAGAGPAAATASGFGAADGQQQQQQVAGAAWARSAPPETLALVVADAGRLSAEVESRLRPSLEARMEGMPLEVLEGVRGALTDAGSHVGGAAADVRSLLVAAVVAKCVGALKQLRGIVATFRMTNKALPSRPSHYVAAILAALRQFLDTEQAGSLAQSDRTAVVQGVADGVTGRYQALVDDTLTTVRRTESSLKRLKTRRAAEGGVDGADGENTTDKMICRQLFLDVQEYGRHVQRFGVQPEQLDSYRQLWRTVAPPEQADNVVIT